MSSLHLKLSLGSSSVAVKRCAPDSTQAALLGKNIEFCRPPFLWATVFEEPEEEAADSRTATREAGDNRSQEATLHRRYFSTSGKGCAPFVTEVLSVTHKLCRDDAMVVNLAPHTTLAEP